MNQESILRNKVEALQRKMISCSADKILEVKNEWLKACQDLETYLKTPHPTTLNSGVNNVPQRYESEYNIKEEAELCKALDKNGNFIINPYSITALRVRIENNYNTMRNHLYPENTKRAAREAYKKDAALYNTIAGDTVWDLKA